MSIIVTDMATAETYFHDFDAVSKRTGTRLRLCGIGTDRKDAERRLRTYNLGPNFDEAFELREPAEEAKQRYGRIG